MSLQKRANSQNLSLAGPAPHGSYQVYHDKHSVEDMLAPEFFLPVRNNLRPGDLMMIQQVDLANNRAKRVLAFVETVVVEVGNDGVELFPRGEIVVIPDKSEAPGTPGLSHLEGQAVTVVADGQLTVRWDVGSKAHLVIGPDGEEVTSFTKDQGGKEAAEEFAARAGQPKAA